MFSPTLGVAIQAAAEYTSASRAANSPFERPIFDAIEFASEHILAILIGALLLFMFYKLLFD